MNKMVAKFGALSKHLRVYTGTFDVRQLRKAAFPDYALYDLRIRPGPV